MFDFNIYFKNYFKMGKIEKFKLFIRFIVSIFASREFGFIYCVIGTFAQTMHTYYLIESVSSLESGWRIFQAIALSIFISSSLLFFTAIADNDEDSPDYKRIHFAVNLFMIIEIIINLYYYAAHLVIGLETPNWFDFIFAILVSCLIPVTIKLYAGIIQAKEWLASLMETNENESSESIQVQNQIDEEYLNSLKQDIYLEIKRGINEEIKDEIRQELRKELFDEQNEKFKKLDNIEILVNEHKPIEQVKFGPDSLYIPEPVGKIEETSKTSESEVNEIASNKIFDSVDDYVKNS